MASTASIPAQTQDELLALGVAGVATDVPVLEESEIGVVGLPVGLPHSFLSLAPTTSASYPASRQVKPAVEAEKAPVADDGQAAILQVSGHEMLNASRSSSMSSEASNASSSQRKRFLRLGPVHDGEHADENGDWSEEVIIG